MRASSYFLPTTKENPSDAVTNSHKLMIRAGLVKKVSSGLYSYLPMGLRILQKIEKIVRDEMNASNSLEFLLPILTPADLWKKTGRWDLVGKELFRLSDRHNVENLLGPTHEETFSFIMKSFLKSYKDLPLNVYQIHTKFRDEIRPRFGVIRSREFIMKDAYSFHIGDDCLENTYQTMRKVYRDIFSKCGLKTMAVEADSGTMGGSKSEEFMVLSKIGEETILFCDACDYKSNQEKTPLICIHEEDFSSVEKEKIHTPNAKTIEQVVNFCQVSTDCTIKAILLSSKKRNILVFVQGDRELNLNKLSSFLNLDEVEPMSYSQIESLGLYPGFVGPCLETEKKDIEVYYDISLNFKKPYTAAINEKDYHMKGFILEDQIGKKNQVDLSIAVENDLCPSCKGSLQSEKGIEVGHIFKLGKKYTESFNIEVLDKNAKLQTLTMGCYGLGINRTMAAIIEQHNDENGICFPINVCPFEIALVSISKKPEEISKVHEIYENLINQGLEVFWDDRDKSAGFKLKDADLIGFPIRIFIGKEFFLNSNISLYNRKTKSEEIFTYEKNDFLEKLLKLRSEVI